MCSFCSVAPQTLRSASVFLMEKPALVVIDMLHDFLESWEVTRRQRLVSSINELVGSMRSLGYPVMWVRQEFEPDLRDAFREMKIKGIRITIKGTQGCQIVSELAVAPSDLVIVKKRYSAFYGTNLDQVLKRLKPDTLIIAGINTHACIRMTAIDAYQRDWEVILATDCVDSHDQEHHETSLRYMRDKIATVMTNQEIRSALAAR
jgi:nicotinamidase-related amidase